MTTTENASTRNEIAGTFGQMANCNPQGSKTKTFTHNREIGLVEDVVALGDDVGILPCPKRCVTRTSGSEYEDEAG